MTEITQKDYKAAADLVLQFQGKDPATLSSEDKEVISKNLAIMAKYQSTIGNAAVNNPSIDPNYILSELSTLEGKNLDPAMILNLAAGRPALWQPDTAPYTPSKEAGLGGWTSSPFVRFLFAVQDLARVLRDQNRTLAEQEATLGKLEWELGKDMGAVKKAIKDNEASMYRDMMISSIVMGSVSVGLSVASFAMKFASAAKMGQYKQGTHAGDYSYKTASKRLDASAGMADGIASSISHQFAGAAENAIRAGYTTKGGELEQKDQILQTAMQRVRKAAEVVQQEHQAAMQQLNELLRGAEQASSELRRNSGIGVRG